MVCQAPVLRLATSLEPHWLNVGSSHHEVAFDHSQGEGGHRRPSIGSTKYAPQRSQFEPIRGQPGAARALSRSGMTRVAPCKRISSSPLYAAFQSHFVHATKTVERGSSRSR